MRAKTVTVMALTLVLAGSALTAQAAVAPVPHVDGQRQSSAAWLRLGAQLAGSAAIRPLFDLVGATDAIDPDNDGRVTFLLLGSDARGGGVSRTDTIMIMSLTLSDGVLNVASIPRDTARIDNPFEGGEYPGKINTILGQLMDVNATVEDGLEDFTVVIEDVLHVSIDYYAMIKFGGFHAFVDEIEPVMVRNNKAAKDTKFWDNPALMRGVYFPKSLEPTYPLWAWQPDTQAGGGPLCNGLFQQFLPKGPFPPEYWCHRALPFVRTRKGPANSDFPRTKRQQNFVLGGIERATDGSFELTDLLATVQAQKDAAQFWTNFDLTNEVDTLALFNALAPATVGAQVSFKPKVWSLRIPGTTSYDLNLCAVRTWAQTYLGGTGC